MGLRLLLLLTICVALLWSDWTTTGVDAKKKKKSKKKKSKKRATTLSNDPMAEIEVDYTNEEDKDRKLRQLKAKMRADQPAEDDEEELERKKAALAAEEEGLRKNVLRAILTHGEFSKEKADALHKLGRNVYQQGKFEDVMEVAQGIVKIHEKIDGPEAMITAEALGNEASVAYRLGRKKQCRIAMERALYIIIKTHGIESKEVLLHQGKMLTFKMKDAQQLSGMSYEDYLEYLEDEL